MSLDDFQPQRGDRRSLTFDQRELLENEVLPRARLWAREFPGLAAHGKSTLVYWGEVPPPPMATPHSNNHKQE